MDLLTKSRTLLGVLLLDLPRFVLRLTGRKNAYLAICNRHERLEASPDGLGFRCDWKWASELHAPKHLPYLGLRLAKRALRDHPIRRLKAPDNTEGQAVSFVIGHRGMDRLPHLLATLESIAGQEAASVECVVVEQDSVARIAEHLPSWVRYVHTPPPTPDMPYCRSWAFNIGVNHVSGSILVLHDNDMLVPADYAANVVTLMGLGYDVVNLKRFVIYLSERHTRAVFDGTAGLTDAAPFSIVQNLEGGGSVAITRQAYDEIGGMDESFIGWGGEDNEFWERAQSRRVWPYAYLPLVHLWHPGQAEKSQSNSHGGLRYRELSSRPVAERIAALRDAPRGRTDGPHRTEQSVGARKAWEAGDGNTSGDPAQHRGE